VWDDAAVRVAASDAGETAKFVAATTQTSAVTAPSNAARSMPGKDSRLADRCRGVTKMSGRGLANIGNHAVRNTTTVDIVDRRDSPADNFAAALNTFSGKIIGY
jgi:hypothetical protein